MSEVPLYPKPRMAHQVVEEQPADTTVKGEKKDVKATDMWASYNPQVPGPTLHTHHPFISRIDGQR